MYDIEHLKREADGHDRRAFLQRMSAAGLGAAATALLAGCGGGSTSNGPVTTAVRTSFPNVSGNTDDQVVLNFCYTFELMQAALYLLALNVASGQPIAQALQTPAPAPGSTAPYVISVASGSISTALAPAAFTYLVEFAYVHAAHAAFLKTTLGGPPTANAILPGSGKYLFPPSTYNTDNINNTNQAQSAGPDLGSIFNNLLSIQENMASAYLGAIPSVDDVATAQVLSTIYSTECRHAALIEYSLGNDPGPPAATYLYDAGNLTLPGSSGDANNVFQDWAAPTQVLGILTQYFVPN